MSPIERYLKNYLDHLEIEKNRSRHTRAAYERYLNAFFAHAKVREPRDITAGAVRAFRIALARPGRGRRGDLKKSTQSYYVIAIRNFLRFLAKRGIRALSAETIELPKLPTRQIEIPREEELDRLLHAPDVHSLRGLRDRAILETLFSTGLRLAELCGLERYANLDAGELTVRGKGGRLRLVFLSQAARAALKAYLARRMDADGALFVSLPRDGVFRGVSKTGGVLGRITPRAVQRLVDSHARRAGIAERVTPHMLRHLFATDLLANGADLRSVQELLGHASVSTTQIYTHVTNRALREAHQAFHARRRNKRLTTND